MTHGSRLLAWAKLRTTAITARQRSWYILRPLRMAPRPPQCPVKKPIKQATELPLWPYFTCGVHAIWVTLGVPAKVRTTNTRSCFLRSTTALGAVDHAPGRRHDCRRGTHECVRHDAKQRLSNNRRG